MPGRVARALEQALHLDAFDRMIVTLAAHPEGVGASDAWLLVWDPRDRVLIPRQHLSALGPVPELIDALGAAPTRDGTETGRLDPGTGIAPERLTGVAGAAWTTGSIALGDAEAGGMPWCDGSGVAAIPIPRGAGPYALLVVTWVSVEEGERRAALESIAELASRALDHLDRASELRWRERQGAALAELARAAVSPVNLAEIFHLAARLAVQACDASGSAVWRARDGGRPRLEVTHGQASVRERLGRALGPLAAAAMEEIRPKVVARATEEFLISPDAAAQFTELVMVPMVAYGRPLGAIALYDRGTGHPAEYPALDARALQFLTGMADVVALALDQAERFDQAQRAEHLGRELKARIQRCERLAALGEVAVRLGREARHPVASIGAFARRVHGELPADDPHKEYLEVVIREVDRLERLLAEPLEQGLLSPPSVKMESVNVLLQEVLQSSCETLVRRRIRLVKKFSPEIPRLLLDVGRVRHAFMNILQNALEAVMLGGRVRVETRRVHPYVVVEVAHDGPRAAGDALEQLFVPFGTQHPGGPGVGLAAAYRIVREHGGEIRTRADGEWSSILTFTLPIHDNQDRRKVVVDRRQAFNDRRARFPHSPGARRTV